jgi:HD-GYP domain-containing protein (c-di-GMP phosphodiesterase class II)
MNNLRPGQKLGTSLMLSRGAMLLRKGSALTPSLIRRIARLGYQGLYIEDELSEGIEITDVISNDLRVKTQDELQRMFYSVESNITSSVKKSVSNIKAMAKDIVDEILSNRHVMINIIDLRTYDDYTYGHCLNVTVLAVVIGTALKLSRSTIYELALGALVHDIGKMFVAKEILNKPSRLTPEEFEEIKKHSELGYNYLSESLDIPETSTIVALQHHEQYGGNGYPNRLAGTDIHQFGRIVSVADVYDALTADRPYRKAMLPSDAIEYIMGGFETMFDPKCVRALVKKVAPYPIGTCVRLSTGEEAIVVKNYEATSMRPLVKLIVDNKPSNQYINLSHDHSALSITVQEILNL